MTHSVRAEHIKLLALSPESKDVFCSYARIDDRQRLVSRTIDRIAYSYHVATGVELTRFQDTSDIATAALWEETLSTELARCRILLAFLSPSYIKSEWCRREWFSTEDREEELRVHRLDGFAPSLIVPVLLRPLAHGRFDPEERVLVERVTKRQWLDLTSLQPDTVRFNRQVDSLIADLIDILDSIRSYAAAVPEEGAIISDGKSGLEWAGLVPKVQMSIEEGERYVKELRLGGHAGLEVAFEGRTRINYRSRVGR